MLQWLSSALKSMGYDSVYAEKTREAMGAEGQVDGCALCWRSDKFFIRDSRVVSFNAKAMMLEEQLPKCVGCSAKSNPFPAVLFHLSCVQVCAESAASRMQRWPGCDAGV